MLNGVDPKDLETWPTTARRPSDRGVVALIGVSEDGKASAVVAVTADLVARVSAVELVRVASVALGGKGGGGRPDMAQAGGPEGPGGSGDRGRRGGARRLIAGGLVSAHPACWRRRLDGRWFC